MKIKSILFDLDGTLINSMDYHYLAWQEAFKEYKIEIKKNEYFKFEGMSLNLIAQKFFNDNYINFNKEQVSNIVKKKKKLFKENTSFIKIYYGVKKFLKILKKKNYKLAIVTSSHYDQVQSSISSNFMDLFDTIVTGEMTKKNKPNPDPYKLAAKKLKSSSSECLVFENAPLGIKAAKKAKMTCVAITNTNNQKELSNADYVINRFSDIYIDKEIKKKLNLNEKI